MKEPDIARKCAVGLAVLALLASVSVMLSWWLASAGGPELAATPPNATPDLKHRPTAVPPLPEIEPAVSQEQPSVPDPAVAAVQENPKPERTQLERRSFQLEMENARLRGRLDDMLNWILDNVRGTFPLPEKQLANLRLMPVDPDLAVSDDLIQLLRLTQTEVGRLDAAFMGTRSVLQEIEVENISVDQPADNQVLLNIPPYTEEGEVVREELYGELQRTLGTARFQRFQQVAEDGLEEKFEYFGDVDRTLQFEAVLDEVTGLSRLFVRDERVLPHKEDPMRLDIIASERIVSELPEEYYLYWDWLPDSVTRFARNN